MTEDNDSHWLTRPETIRKLWWIFYAVLALTVLAQLVIYVKDYFTVDGWFGFGAVFGFLSCLLMVLSAKDAPNAAPSHAQLMVVATDSESASATALLVMAVLL